ncbi:uncharacterized protein EMH_0098880 [Eimeria mitis]|uniref:Uncharacterized protein n=1 Tax=Eimeria mitis TaxID=44415 RepID=U6JMZ6_9EIME|nr:uncharacterized protein EMH_0098880 [Eimeria mitis]CDJ26920.1 hypothetical protein, conserved [Eimeria mitis]
MSSECSSHHEESSAADAASAPDCCAAEVSGGGPAPPEAAAAVCGDAAAAAAAEAQSLEEAQQPGTSPGPTEDSSSDQPQQQQLHVDLQAMAAGRQRAPAEPVGGDWIPAAAAAAAAAGPGVGECPPQLHALLPPQLQQRVMQQMEQQQRRLGGLQLDSSTAQLLGVESSPFTAEQLVQQQQQQQQQQLLMRLYGPTCMAPTIDSVGPGGGRFGPPPGLEAMGGPKSGSRPPAQLLPLQLQQKTKRQQIGFSSSSSSGSSRGPFCRMQNGRLC